MGWVEFFTPDFDAGNTCSIFKIIGDTGDLDVGVDGATDSVLELYDYLQAKALWGTSVLGVKASYDGVHRIVLYLHADIGSEGGALDEVSHVASSWGAHAVRLGLSGESSSPIVGWL